jgi:hypothetical protein
MAPPGRGFTAELPLQDDPQIGRERIVVRHQDGRTEEFHLHDYERLYSLPGVYEQIVQERLQCRSPQVMAALLAETVDAVGWTRAETKVIDVAAGNGVSGDALRSEGLEPVLGIDIVPAARTAALRDRPAVYGDYLTIDLLQMPGRRRQTIRELGARALCCVAPVGHGPQVPPPVLIAGAELVTRDALVAHMHDPAIDPEDPITTALWGEHGWAATELRRHRYVHRRTVNGDPYEMDGVVWRLRRNRL